MQIEGIKKYSDNIANLIPSEIIAIYMIFEGYLQSYFKPDYPSNNLLINISAGFTLFLLLITPFYSWHFYGIRNCFRILLISTTFLIWIYGIGGVFKILDIHNQLLASSILLAWTLITPFFSKAENPMFYRSQKVKITNKTPKIKTVIRQGGLIEWDNGRKQYLGKTATIKKIDKKMEIAYLDIDLKQYSWPFEWIEPQGEINATKD